MKSSVLFLALILVITVMKATTYIDNSTVSGEWTLSGSPYYVMNDVTIPEGQTLSIQPGVHVYTNGLFTINVNGTLRAIGTPADSIYFTAADTTAGWHGLHFNQVTSEPDSSYITHCHISYGKTQASGDATYGYREGGGIFMRNRNKVGISYTTITKCQANTTGGGVYVYGGTLNMHHSIVSHNKANIGGGLHTTSIMKVILKDSVISNNSALTAVGGGLLIYGLVSATGTITNCLICNNSSTSNGGGVYMGIGAFSLVNCTIAYNSSTNPNTYGAIYCNSPTFSVRKNIRNCIITNNTVNSSGLQGLSAFTDISFCNIENGSVAGNGFTISNTIAGDPLFISPPGGMGVSYNGLAADFNVSSYSPCIDSGDPMLWDADGTCSDIGCYPYLHKAWFQATPVFITAGDVVNLQNLSMGYDIPQALAEWDVNADETVQSNSYDWSYQFFNPGVYTIKLTETAGALRDSCYQTVVVQQNQLPPPENVVIDMINSDIVLSWNPVTETVNHIPVVVNYYVVYYCDRPDGYFRYLGTSESGSSQFVHSGISSINRGFYKVIGFEGSDRDLQEFIRNKLGLEVQPKP